MLPDVTLKYLGCVVLVIVKVDNIDRYKKEKTLSTKEP